MTRLQIVPATPRGHHQKKAPIMHITRTRLAAAAAGVVLIGAPVLGVAAAAQAHDQALSVTCTQISLSLSNYPAGSTVGGIIDGVDLGTSTFGPSFSQSAPLDPAVPHTYSITVKSGDGDHRYDKTFTGKSDPACIPIVTPPPVEPPVVTPPPVVVPPTKEPTPPVVTPPVVVTEPRIQDYIDCLGGRFVLDNTGSTTDVTYTVQGTDIIVPAGTATHTDAAGVLFQPYDGTYTITAGDQTWTFPSSGNCPTTPPTEEPTTPPTDEPSTPPTDEPTEQPTEPVTPPSTPNEPGTSGTTPATSTPATPPLSSPNGPGTEPTSASYDSPVKQAVSPVVQPADALAFTGAADLTGWIALVAVAIASGAALIIVPILRRRAAQGQ